MLAVRMLVGPAITAAVFLSAELRAAIGSGERAKEIRLAWGMHAIGLAVVAAIMHSAFGMPAWAYAGAAYLGLSLLAVRSFCEHRWAEAPDGRSVIVERSSLSLLFLNNNLHLVHHRHPGLPWYALPAAYRARRSEWRTINGGYVFSSYGAVARAFALRPREPVVHPARAGR